MTKKLLIAAALVIATTGCKSEIDGKPAATVEEPAATNAAPAEEKKAETTGAAAAEAKAVPFNLEKSKVEWVGSKVTLDHDGGFKTFTGSATFGAEGKLQSIETEIDATSVWSDNEKLTGHLKSPDFFDVEKFPKASFKSTKIEHNDDGSLKVTGELDLRGVKKTISFPATAKVEGDTYIATSEFTLMREDFGIVYKGKPDDLIKKEVLMKLTVAVPAPKQG